MRVNQTYPQTGLRTSAIPAYLLQLETAVCDGIHTDIAIPRESRTNLFGRRVEVSHTPGAGHLAGWAGSGWRVAGFLSHPDKLSLETRRRIVERQLPVVLHLPAYSTGFDDWIILQAIDTRDAIRLTLLAHHVAERALLPVVVITDPSHVLEDTLPTADTITRYLGAPEALIQTPTPAQELLFGPRRRCIPNQFSFDQPVVRNAAASEEDAQRSALARRKYVQDHVPDVLQHAEDELAALLPGHQSAVVTHGNDQADHVLLAVGPCAAVALQMPEKKGLFSKSPIQYVALRVLNPWPEEALLKLFQKKKSWTCLLPLDAGHSAWQSLADRCWTPGPGMPARQSVGYYRSAILPDQVQVISEKITAGALPGGRFFVDMLLHPHRSDSAQQEVLLHHLKRTYPDLDQESLLTSDATPSPAVNQGHFQSLPEIVRNQEDHGPPYSRLTHFYQDVILHRQLSVDAPLATDPFRVQGVMPPLTDLLRIREVDNATIPVLDADACTACGQCLVQCPFAAMPSLAIRLEDLLRAGMASLSKKGQSTSSLTPLVKNLAVFWSTRCRPDEVKGKTLAELPHALAELLQQKKVDAEKEQKIHAEFEPLQAALNQMTWVKSPLYFDGPESRQAGEGELFSIAIDPHACTGCGICVEVCPEDALSFSEDESVLESARSAHQFWEQLPDTAATTITRIHQDPDAAPLSGIMLSRHYYQSVIGGESRPDLWGTRMILHTTAAIAESIIQPRWHQKLTALAELRAALDTQVRQHLQEAMPGSLDADLEQLLDRSGQKQVALKDILLQLNTTSSSNLRIDTGKLGRWIHLGRELAQLEEALSIGTTGAGRARYGIYLCGQLADALVQYPHHPFQVPVWIEPALDIDQVRALVATQQRHILDQIRLLRRAALESKGQYRPEIQDEAISALTWSDLTTSEKEYLPPLLIVMDGRDLQSVSAKDLIALLSEDAPVKILSIQRDLPGPSASYERQGWVLPLITSRCCPVYQTSPSQGGHFSTSFQQALHSPGPTLIHALGFSDPILESGTWLERVDDLVVAGLFPLLSWVPRDPGDFLSKHLEITNIPDLEIPVEGLVPEWIRQTWSNEAALPADWKALLTTEWRTWLEWSGRLQSGETDRMKASRQALEEKFASERKALMEEHKTALQELEQGMQEEIRNQLVDRLYQLAQSQRAARLAEQNKLDQTV